MRPRGDGQVITDFLRPLQHVEACRPAVGCARERERRHELLEALRWIVGEVEHGGIGHRVRVVTVERVLAADLVQRSGRDDPGVRGGDRSPRLVDAAVRVVRRRAAAAVAGVVLLLAGEADEDALIRIDLPVGLAEVRVAVLRLGKAPFEQRVELRLPGADGDELVFLRALDRTEEMDFVLDDRSADGGAELVAAVVRLGRALGVVGGLLEPVHRVQRLVAEVLEGLAADQVGAALGRNRDDAAGGPAIFGRGVAQVHLELADGVLRKVLSRLARARLFVPQAVDQERAGVGERAGAEIRVELPRPHGVLARAGHEQRERHGLSRRQRQRLDLLLRDDARHVGPGRFDHRRLAGDGQRLLDPLQLHRDVVRHFEADRQRDVFQVHDRKAPQFRFHVVPAGRQSRHAVPTVGFAHGGANHAGFGVSRGQRDTGQHAALDVRDNAHDGTAGGLRVRRHHNSGSDRQRSGDPDEERRKRRTEPA